MVRIVTWMVRIVFTKFRTSKKIIRMLPILTRLVMIDNRMVRKQAGWLE